MIVLATSILVYAKGREHPHRESCRSLIRAVENGRVAATTTPEVIQEFAHVRSRRRPRSDAAALARGFAILLSPLLSADERALEHGLRLFERHPRLGAFDAMLAATAIEAGAEALISADTSFGEVRGLRLVRPSTPAFHELVGE